MFCPQCGKKLNDNDVFCAFCGETLNNNAAAQQNFQASQPQFNAPAAKKTGSVITRFVGAAVSLAMTAGFVLFIKPGYLRSHDDDSSSRTAAESRVEISAEVSQDTSEKKAVTSVSPTETTTTATAPPETTEQTTTTVQTASTEKTTTTAPTTTTAGTVSETSAPASDTTAAKTTDETFADDELEKKNAVYAQAMSLSTTERPEFSEFEWCFGQSGLVYEAPAGADMITEPLGYSGDWKAMVIYNPSNSAGTFMRELDNINIEVNGDSAVITIDWYLMQNDGVESYSEEDMADSVFLGSVTDTGIYASGDAEISINSLWEQDGRQYALGAMITSDGLPAYLAMVRP